MRIRQEAVGTPCPAFSHESRRQQERLIGRTVVQARHVRKENQMTMLKTVSVATVTLMLAAAPASAQTETTTPAPTSPTESATTPSQPSGMESDAMRQTVREMMLEMMHDGSLREGRRGGDRNWKKERRHHAEDRGGSRMHDRGWRRGGMGSPMMHGAGMRMMFAIVDADGDEALSLTEIQEFDGRIFRAVDDNGDGKVEMTEIEAFFHPAGNDDDDDDTAGDD